MSFLNDLPNLVHLYAYGCRGYLLNEAWFKDINCSARKNWPRADIGYLVGYKDDNIFRMWTPKAKRTGYIVVEIRDVGFDETVFYNLEPLEPLRFLQPDPIVEINSDDDSDTGSIVSIPPTADPQPRDDLYDSEEEEDPLAEDPFADRPELSTDESVYTASESSEIPQEPLGRGHRICQLSAAARKNLEQSGSVYRSALHYKARQLKPVPAEPGPAGPAANEPDPPELPLVTRAAFMAGCIARVYQKDLPPESRGWKDVMKHPYKAEWVQVAKVEW